MSAALIETQGWSRSQWSGALVLIVVLHALGLFIFSNRDATPRTAPQLSNIYFVAEPESDARLAEWLSLQDPMIFVQRDPQSLARFKLQARFSYELTNWTEPFRWLAPSDQYLADDFNLYVANAVRPSTLATEKMPPALSEVESSSAVWPSHAVLHLEGGLAGRRLVSKLPLPRNESDRISTNTVVGVRVDASGETFSAALIYGSGSPAADQRALTYASQARFEAEPDSAKGSGGSRHPAFTFGRLIFQWFPIAVSATNQVTAKP